MPRIIRRKYVNGRSEPRNRIGHGIESSGKIKPEIMKLGIAVKMLACIACAEVDEIVEINRPIPSAPIKKTAERMSSRIKLP